MAIEKPLKVRDYLEPRFGGNAGSRPASAARKNPASFQDILKNEKLASAGGAEAGMKISQYLKRPILMPQIRRPTSTAGVSNDAAAGSRAGAGTEPSRFTKAPQPAESNRSSNSQSGPSARRSTQNLSNEPRTVGPSIQPVEKSVQQAAAKYDLAPELIRSVIRAESNFQVDAVSPAGAKGLMQLMPETAKELGVTNPFDIHQNIDGGARYLRLMLDRFGGNLKRALAAYNAGPGAVEHYNGNVPYAETRQYVRSVMRSAGLG
jgi:soluble lytic murein transglycosylase-like protein